MGSAVSIIALDELLPLRFSCGCVSAGRAVGQFDQRDHGDGDVDISGGAGDGGEHLPCVLSPPLAMALDRCFYILGEVSIHDRSRVLG
jgi:hypothetical protein